MANVEKATEALESAIYNLENNVPVLGKSALTIATEQVKAALRALEEE
ncbi:MAG: hypothetical protein KAR06_09500 [Deltaproteobacteria bacterium]|nr:hypothetical protein [Deltaproteobacteria bacterium]